MAISASDETKRKVFPLRLKSPSNQPAIPTLWQPEGEAEDFPNAPITELRDLPQGSAGTLAAAPNWDEEILNLKESLLQSRRQAILSRSQSLNLNQRQRLCREAMSLYERAQEILQTLKGRALRAGLEARRRLRAIEGAAEWRTIRHAIRRSVELNQVTRVA